LPRLIQNLNVKVLRYVRREAVESTEPIALSRQLLRGLIVGARMARGIMGDNFAAFDKVKKVAGHRALLGQQAGALGSLSHRRLG
jgi:hypothetical protein